MKSAETGSITPQTEYETVSFDLEVRPNPDKLLDERDRLWCRALLDESPAIIARVTGRFLKLCTPVEAK